MTADRPEVQRVGGMAIVEGVMLRGPDRWVAAARRPDGTIAVRTGALPDWAARWSSTPLVRGIVALAESLTLGVRAVLWSGDLHAPAGKGRGGDVGRAQVALAVVPGLAVTIGLLFLLPAMAARWLAADASGTTAAVVEALARLVILAAYLGAVGRLPMIRRVFAYHGAEHKVVALHEAGLDDQGIGAARAMPSHHARCGTTFLAVVVAVTSAAHLATAPLHGLALPALLGFRLLLVPAIAAVAYELLTAANACSTRRWARVVLVPGMALQSMTVGEPDDDQLEVALVALRHVAADVEAGDLVLVA